ncbi:MAG: sensor histidine kinase, partial [Sulfuritalea sp.]|nr:sensor histidine kinase [Sulfuritalea sp.]
MRKDGSTFWASVILTAIRDPAGNLRGFAKLIKDMTEIRQVDAEMANARSMAEKAAIANADFLSDMGHELRTSLNAMLGFAQLMESDTPPPTPAQKKTSRRFCRRGWYLLELINEILDLAMLDSGGWRGRLSRCRWPTSCSNAGAPSNRRRRRAASASAFPRSTVIASIKADHTRVKQVLINLLSNAIKYNQVGDRCSWNAARRRRNARLNAARRAATPARQRHRHRPRGCRRNNWSNCFAPSVASARNQRRDSRRDRPGRAKRLVGLMGGAMGVESTVGEGSVFSDRTGPRRRAATCRGRGRISASGPAARNRHRATHPCCMSKTIRPTCNRSSKSSRAAPTCVCWSAR